MYYAIIQASISEPRGFGFGALNSIEALPFKEWLARPPEGITGQVNQSSPPTEDQIGSRLISCSRNRPEPSPVKDKAIAVLTKPGLRLDLFVPFSFVASQLMVARDQRSIRACIRREKL